MLYFKNLVNPNKIWHCFLKKGVSDQQAHTSNSAGPVEDPTPPKQFQTPLQRRAAHGDPAEGVGGLCAHPGASTVWGESLISAMPHYFQRENSFSERLMIT